jgi:hypothetical protein
MSKTTFERAQQAVANSDDAHLLIALAQVEATRENTTQLARIANVLEDHFPPDERLTRMKDILDVVLDVVARDLPGKVEKK